MCGANSMRRPTAAPQLTLSTPFSLSLPLSPPFFIWVFMWTCKSLREYFALHWIEPCAKAVVLPCPMCPPFHSLPPSLPVSKRCSICNVNWTTAVAIDAATACSTKRNQRTTKTKLSRSKKHINENKANSIRQIQSNLANLKLNS